ncbi:hypothetical protein PR202_gb13678 [Eleusine coracana subsp. coracana]|uniref:Protein kinase domain-containing protein n=1 Tax=Eleusine coracana subsp. coracana TaxID=191504 RepID=A0AAV5EUP6_ELECO|nr:hypothetical protein PR202_gb13678 [Eleusine coracana subsp. coracana]
MREGELSDGLVVAVKKLQAMRNNNTETEFVDELTLGAKLKHENVVKYLGYCMDVTTRSVEYNGQNILAECHTYLLVLEYLPNGSLQDIINEERRVEWPFCYRVIQEIAQGVHYLHEQRVIHSDLKPDNIRFDTRMNPVITDFGISTILPPDDDEIILDRRNGTIGYMAPEMFIDYRLSKKADVFAFGICLLKTIMSTSTSKKCWHDREEWDEMLKEAGGLKGLLHPTVQVDESQLIEMNRCLEVGWLCSDYKPEKRPTMAKAIEMLTQKKRRNKGRVWFDRFTRVFYLLVEEFHLGLLSVLADALELQTCSRADGGNTAVEPC